MVFSNNEFQELRRFVKNTNNAQVIKGFNSLFNNEPMRAKGAVLPKTKDVIIELNNQDSMSIMKILANNGETIGKIANDAANGGVNPIQVYNFSTAFLGAIKRIL